MGRGSAGARLRRGWVTKQWITRKGIERGSRPFTKNSLHRLLANVTHAGKVSCKGSLYEGEHNAIADAGLGRQVQTTLCRNGLSGARQVRNKQGALFRACTAARPARPPWRTPMP